MATQDDLQERLEDHYVRGANAAWTQMLQVCLKGLMFEGDLEAGRARWLIERAQAVHTLRMVCDDFGDNDWPDNLHLSDVIEKHLARYLTMTGVPDGN
jgi:hypothetical protein